MPEQPESQSLTINEAAALHENEWILMRVTERNSYDVPVRGVIVTTGKHRDDIQPTVLALVTFDREPGLDYYTFYGFQLLEPGQETTAALDQAVFGSVKRG